MHGSVMPVNETYVVYKYTGIPRNVIEHTLLDHSLKYLKLTNFIVMVCRKKPVSLTFAIQFRSYQACGKWFLGSNQPLCKIVQIHLAASSFPALPSPWLLCV